MGFYRPGAFKNKELIVEETQQLEPIKLIENTEEKNTEEIENEVKNEVKESVDNVKINNRKKMNDIIFVKPVEVVENVKWKELKKEEDKEDIKKKDDIKPIKYLRTNIYLKKKKYEMFLENEWDILWDMYDRMLNYDEKYLDKIREDKIDKGFYEFSKLIFASLKIY